MGAELGDPASARESGERRVVRHQRRVGGSGDGRLSGGAGRVRGELAIGRELDYKRMVARALTQLGEVARLEGNMAEELSELNKPCLRGVRSDTRVASSTPCAASEMRLDWRVRFVRPVSTRREPHRVPRDRRPAWHRGGAGKPRESSCSPWRSRTREVPLWRGPEPVD